MKKILVKGLFASLLAVLCACTANSQEKVKVKVKTSHHEGWSNFGGNHVPGTWVGYIEDDKVYMQLTGEDWSNGRSFLRADLGTLPEGTEGSFSLTRESGTVTFKGEFAGGKGHGFYKLAENPSFKAYLKEKGFDAPDDDLMINIFFTDINKSYFELLKANGYAEVTNEQLKDLAQQDINRKVLEDYFRLFKTEDWGHPSLNKIVELREHGVQARFVNEFHEMGYKEKIPLERALELRDHGVSPEFITSIQKMGYGDISLERAVELRDHGVSPDFIRSMQEMGYKNITLEKAQELQDHGVNPNYIHSMQNMGYTDISLDKAQELQDHGVNPGFIKSIKDLGFKDISLDKAQELVDHGVNASFIKKMMDKGVNVHTLDEYVRLRDSGFNE